MVIEMIKTPRPKADEVLVKVKACGVCHTDLHCILGEVPFPQPAVFGHEICGEVVAFGPSDRAPPFPIGTKVMSPFIMPCSRCSFCSKGEEDTCETFFALNRLKGHLYDDSTRLVTAGETPEEVAMYSFAGLAEYAVVPRTAVFALPPALLQAGLYEESCVLGCAFFTAYGAIRNAAGFDPTATRAAAAAAATTIAAGSECAGAGDDADGAAGGAGPLSTCVIGCGGVGGALIQLLKYAGCSPIIAVDVTDEALAQAKALGATHGVKSSAETDAVKRISELTGGRKVDVCFEVIGLKRTFEQARAHARMRACMCGPWWLHAPLHAHSPYSHALPPCTRVMHTHHVCMLSCLSRQAIMSVRDGGRCCFIGISDVKTVAHVPITHVVRRRISLVGSYGARASTDMPALLEIAARGGVDLEGAITRRFGLDEAGEAYSLLKARKITGRAIVRFP